MIDPAMLDDIYAAAAFPERWPDLLRRLATQHGARCGCIYSVSDWQRRFLTSTGDQTVFQEYFDEGWMTNNERSIPLLIEHAPCFRTDTDLRTADEIAAMPVYRDFLFPRGFVAGTGTVVQGASNSLINISFEGYPSDAAARAAMPSLNALRPHLARAASLGAQMAQTVAQVTVDALELARTPAAVIDSDGQLRAINPSCEASLGDRAAAYRGRLRFRDAEVNRRIDAALHANRNGATAGASIAIGAYDKLHACVLHLLPLRRQARNLFNSDGIVVLVADPVNRNTPNAALLKLLFDLTKAEAMLTAELAAGRSLRQAAAQRGITYATARTQLRAVFAKTGCHRQGELVALLNAPGTVTPPPD